MKFGSGRLYSEIQRGFENKEWAITEKKINELISKHPVASETDDAKKLLITVQDEIKKEKDKLESEKAKAEQEEKVKKEKEERERKNKIEQAVKSMTKSTDQVENITWFKDKSTNDKSPNSCLYVYFGQKENRIIGPRLYIQYGADDWLFYDKVIFKVDESTFEYVPKEVKRDHNAGKIWEWSDNFVDDDLFGKIRQICSGKKVILRYVGKDYYKDRTIPDSEKYAIARVLDAMHALKASQ